MAGIFLSNYFNGCKDKSGAKINANNSEVVKVVVDTQYIQKDTIVYRKGRDIVKDTTIYVGIAMPVDTQKILKDFYAISVYSDTLRLDSGYVSVIDSISENKVMARKYKADIRHTSISEKIYIKEPFKTTFFWGFSGGIGRGASESSINIFMETRKRKLYGIGAGVINGVPAIKGNVLVKL